MATATTPPPALSPIEALVSLVCDLRDAHRRNDQRSVKALTSMLIDHADTVRPEHLGIPQVVAPSSGLQRFDVGGGYRLEVAGAGVIVEMTRTPAHFNAPELRTYLRDLSSVLLGVERK